MRFNSSDPDIETLYRRIREDLLDLQPDFQRGEVWGRTKQQRLIDTILREWHVPPIHVIKHEDSHIQEVLDGKQRLTAICDFMNNDFPVDGYIEPLSPKIEELHGMKFNELPPKIREKFKQFSIRQFLIDNFTPEEPGELFFRLNSPTYLTAAEQRNAFYGEPRKQIKGLVAIMEKLGIEKEHIGFSNSRMSYDDVFARVCFVFEIKTLHKRITSKDLSDRYRSSTPFSSELMGQLEIVIKNFGEGKELSERNFRFNKATLFSWFVFLLVANKRLGHKIDAKLQTEILSEFERLREKTIKKDDRSESTNNNYENFLVNLFLVFEDRSRARVSNVDSVLIRDIMFWLVFLQISQKHNRDFSRDAKLMNLHQEFKALANQKSTSISLAQKFYYDVINKETWGISI